MSESRRDRDEYKRNNSALKNVHAKSISVQAAIISGNGHHPQDHLGHFHQKMGKVSKDIKSIFLMPSFDLILFQNYTHGQVVFVDETEN